MKGSLVVKIIYFAVLLCWLGFIFSNSLADAEESSKQSSKVVETVEKALDTLGIEAQVDAHSTRKTAHFVEYCLLGIIVGAFCFVFKRPPIKDVAYYLLFGVLIALLDETIQLTSSGRSGQISDVWLDFAAFFCGALITTAVYYYFRRIKAKKI